MPKIVDHEARRGLIAAAFADVARRDGIAAASVRTVAAEAGLSPGALRHYFDSHAGLVRFVAEHLTSGVAVRVQDRMALVEVTDRADPVEISGVLEEIVPLDERRRAEFDVWHAMAVGARSDPALAALSEDSWRSIRRVCRWVVERTEVSTSDAEAAVVDLHALVDGLALQLSLYPALVTPEEARSVLRRRVGSLADTTPRSRPR